MAKYEPKTRETDASVEDFLNSIENPERRADGLRVLEMFNRLTGLEPKMWGPAIVGYGSYEITYSDGRKLDWMMTGFSPRKQNMTLYVICGSPKQPELLAKLGKHTSSVSCLYIKRLSDIDEKVLERIIKDAFQYTKKTGGSC
ncbi:MAG: DUF1801 domain-containing protein [Blastocatellia bacterium]|nr:DUF1801 domain-containing protein [Chloracidobacterium sp.]MBL8183467.1 DUF1801 domain-containing protein [Blastocatellia bacterium]HBE82596.1 hypothetical protein [Blastocatellia bacterium]HRJ89213.1 DUF1801 domain-containing protein [Pyrinomonadaceae bacterium]HRK50997.1 DUF1801 domain-containing protein [Pyrinomonadaceae bacterium]